VTIIIESHYIIYRSREFNKHGTVPYRTIPGIVANE
jgi:hypothetical protein